MFEEHAHPIARSLTRENLQARIRGLLMMAESNDTGALLISCGNETEIALGYATLYGDMCGGISVIGDLSKIDVYRLARYVNRRHGAEIIPAETFTSSRPRSSPTNQFDPFDYSVMAPVVSELVERRRASRSWSRCSSTASSIARGFVPDAEGRTVYDKHTVGNLPRRRRGGRRRHAALGLQAPAGPADPRRLRTGVRLRPARDDHQRLDRRIAAAIVRLAVSRRQGDCDPVDR